MKTITVLTATRAEYGLLKNVIRALQNTGKFAVKVVVTGMHLSDKFGYTVSEIESDGIQIDARIPILDMDNGASGISKTMGNALIRFADYFEGSSTDAILVLGDRYETMAVCIAAMNKNIPIIHLYGGEITEGAIDDAIRHGITKMSYLHLTSTDEYRKRVIQLGEDPERVYTVGAIGVENALKYEKMSLMQLSDSIGFDLSGDFAIVTYHPVTLDNNSADKDVEELLNALDEIESMKYIITKSNADKNGVAINEILEKFAEKRDNVLFIDSLGMTRYMNALSYAKMVIGNSSSGIIEAPSFHIPTVNIGDRQKGRIRAGSVIDCSTDSKSIVKAMQEAKTMDCSSIINPYGDGNAISKIVNAIDKLFEKEIDLKKHFYDIAVD